MVNKLEGVHPLLVEKTQRILAAMEALGFPMMAFEGVRTLKRQQYLYAQGRTREGDIVTNCDGIEKKSNHQVKDDSYGYAVDCVFLDNGKPSWREDFPWSLYGKCAVSLGLKWGGNWKGKMKADLPHIELPYGQRTKNR